MDTSLVASKSHYIPLEDAMRQKLKLKKKLMKAVHHAEFLKGCIDNDRIPIGLRLQYSEIHMMDAPHTSRTRAAIAQTYKTAEHNICKALQEHYTEIKTQTERQLDEVETHIQNHPEKDLPEFQHKYKVFLSRLERTEDDVQGLLQERRTHKLGQLSSTRTYTWHSQNPTSSLHTQTRHPSPQTPTRRIHPRTTATQSRTSHTHSQTPYARSHAGPSSTEYQRRSTLPKRYLGQKVCFIELQSLSWEVFLTPSPI